MDRRDVFKSGGACAVMQVFGSTSASAATGFFVPPEEGKHQRTFMQWPVNRRVHPDPVFLEMAQETIADIANTIVEFEPVTMLAAKEDHSNARAKLSRSVEIWDIPTEDLWCRDAGPIFVVNDAGDIAISHIQFNGWGRKQIHKRDSKIAERVAERLDLALMPVDLRGEAGGVEQDGHGLLLAHESSWLTDSRNPNVSLDEIERRLLRAYGAEEIIWSPGVWGEDITDYHIDSLARFTGPGRVLINLPEEADVQDPFHSAAIETYHRLLEKSLDVEVILEPNIRRIDSIDFVASYANYYVCNGAVIVAEFGDLETDRMARQALERHYPGREVVALNVDTLGEMGGGIHCATQQMPAV